MYVVGDTADMLVAPEINFLCSIMIVEPLKIMVIAALLSFIFGRRLNTDFDSVNLTNPDLGTDETYLNEPSTLRMKHVVRTDPRYYLPVLDHILAVNRRLKTERKIRSYLKDMLILTIFTVTLTVVVYMHKPPIGYYITHNIELNLVESIYTEGTPVEDVRLKNDIYDYINTTLIPSVYNIPPDENDTSQFYLSDLTTVIVGVPRIRQVRVNHDDCILPSKLKQVSKECFRKYSFSQEETDDYNTAWAPLYNGTSQEENSAWVYHTALELETVPIYAAHNTYSGGGYVAELKSSREMSELYLEYWKANNWIDSYTRAVIIEMMTFHPPSQLFTSTSIVFEYHATGAYTSFTQILPAKLYYYQSEKERVVIPFEVCLVIFTVWMTVREIMKMAKEKKKYWQEPWNFVEWFIIILSYTGIILYLKKLFLISRTLKSYKSGKCRNVFVSFYPPLLADFGQHYVMAFLLTASIFRFVRFLNLNKRVLVISMAIRRVFSTIMVFGFVMFSGIVVLSAAGVLMLGPFCAEMKTPVDAMVSVFHVLVLDTRFELAECFAFEITYLKGPVYAMTMGFVVIVLGFPLLQSILDFAMVDARRNRTKIQEEYAVLDYLYRKLRFHVKRH